MISSEAGIAEKNEQKYKHQTFFWNSRCTLVYIHVHTTVRSDWTLRINNCVFPWGCTQNWNENKSILKGYQLLENLISVKSTLVNSHQFSSKHMKIKHVVLWTKCRIMNLERQTWINTLCTSILDIPLNFNGNS